MEITKVYAISNWCQYTESDLGDVSCMTLSVISTVMGGHPCKVRTYMDQTGNGFEERIFSVSI